MHGKVLTVAVRTCRSACVGFEFSEGEVEHLILGLFQIVKEDFECCRVQAKLQKKYL